MVRNIETSVNQLHVWGEEYNNIGQSHLLFLQKKSGSEQALHFKIKDTLKGFQL